MASIFDTINNPALSEEINGPMHAQYKEDKLLKIEPIEERALIMSEQSLGDELAKIKARTNSSDKKLFSSQSVDSIKTRVEEARIEIKSTGSSAYSGSNTSSQNSTNTSSSDSRYSYRGADSSRSGYAYGNQQKVDPYKIASELMSGFTKAVNEENMFEVKKYRKLGVMDKILPRKSKRKQAFLSASALVVQVGSVLAFFSLLDARNSR